MAATMLTNEAGEVTSHIQGMFNRTIKMMASGVRPVYVFDGKPPQMKGGELAKRIAKRAKAEVDLAEAKEGGDIDEVDKFSRRLVKVTRQHNEDCKELLKLMGVPFVDAPCEAEAQCAELAKKGKVYATATEDMDAITFRTPKLLRRFTFSQGKDKQAILEIDSEAVIRGLKLTYEQFIDLCIMCGCDYCSTIKGIGPKTALKLIRQYATLEKVIEHLKKEKKYDIPVDWMPIRVPKVQPKPEGVDDESDGDDGDEAEDGAESGVGGGAEEAAQGESSAPSSGADMMVESSAEAEVEAGVKVEVDETGANGSVEADAEAKEGDEADGAAAAQVKAEADTPEDPATGAPEAQTATSTAAVTAPLGSHSEYFDPNAESSRAAKAEADTEANAEQGQNTGTTLEDTDVEFEVVPALYEQARRLFTHHDVLDAEGVELRWAEPDEEGLRAFLVDKMGFSLERVTNGIKRLQEAQQKKSQKRMDRCVFMKLLTQLNVSD